MSSVRQALEQVLLHRLTEIEGVLSASLVGSICERDDLSSIADIDTIVICGELTEELFWACISCAESIQGEELGLPDRTVFVNYTFGPLKFDTPHRIVVHLMIYDVRGHREHVLKSPFTCHDWERNAIQRGPRLRDIYPVLKLQPRDFLAARRGLTDYVRDLERGVISYRRYEFHGGAPSEVTTSQEFDSRHRGEYAYHIMRNLIMNYAKMVHGENVALDGDDLIVFWRRELAQLAEYADVFLHIREIKLARGDGYPDDVVDVCKAFVNQLSAVLGEQWERAGRVVLFRHGPTGLNDGSFLGQGRDPGLTDATAIDRFDSPVTRAYSSPLARARETLERLAPDVTIAVDARLAEIDYGDAEGLTYREMGERYAGIVEAWAQGRDPSFPNGENTAAVADRLWDFMDSVQASDGETVLVVTHNVVLRCLCGRLLGIEPRNWYKLRIPHLVAFDVLRRDGRWYPNFLLEAKAAITDGLIEYEG